MNVIPTPLAGVVVIEPKLYCDARGYFFEMWNQARYAEARITAGSGFLQDNVSVSAPGVLRGLHLQWPSAQAKLVTVLAGEVFDVAVDVRHGSPTFGHWFGVTLSARDHRQIYIPEGFAHGFLVTAGEAATVHYKVNAPYAPADELTVLWDDPDVGIEWPAAVTPPTLSPKDREGLRLRDIPPERLPRFA